MDANTEMADKNKEDINNSQNSVNSATSNTSRSNKLKISEMFSEQRCDNLGSGLAAGIDAPLMSSSQEEIYNAEINGEDIVQDSIQKKMEEIEKSLREGKMEMSTGVILSMFAALQESIKSIKSEVKNEIKVDINLSESQKLQSMEMDLVNEIDNIAEAID